MTTDGPAVEPDPEASLEDYETVVETHARIRRLVESWEGRPATIERDGDTWPAIDWDERESGPERVHWDEFFERVETHDVALAYDSGATEEDDRPEFDLVPRGGGSVDDEPAGDGPDDRSPAADVLDKRDPQEFDRRAAVREREAEKQENPDNHRDREPFQG